MKLVFDNKINIDEIHKFCCDKCLDIIGMIPTKNFSSYLNIILKISDEIQNKKVNWNQELFEKISKDIISAIDDAFLLHKKDFKNKENLYRMFKSNLYIFSAAKTSRIIDDLNKINKKIDKTSNITLKEYKQQVLSINEQYNKNWIKSEYNTAFSIALNSLKYEEALQIFPYAKWIQIKRPTAREIHKALDGKVFQTNKLDIIPPTGFNCYDNETKIFTKDRGFILFKDLEKNDMVYTLNLENKIPEWQTPIYYHRKKYKGDLILIKNTNLNICVTPEHKLLLNKGWDRKMKREKLVFKRADSKIIGDRIYKSNLWKGNNFEYILIGKTQIKMNIFCKFMGWYLSEGSTTLRKDNNKYQINISQIKYQDILFKDLEEFPFRIWYTKKGIIISNQELGEYLYKFGKSHQKYIPEEIKNTNIENIKLFLDSYILGDGTKSKPKNNRKIVESIFSTSIKMINDLIELIMKTGKSCTYNIRNKKGTLSKFKNGKEYACNNDCYGITISPFNYNTIKNKSVTNIKYDNYVYGVTVSNYHTLLVERNGKICWCGNCACILEYMETPEGNKVSNVNEIKEALIDTNEYDKMKEFGFDVNPAKTGKLFNKIYGNVNSATLLEKGLKSISDYKPTEYRPIEQTQKFNEVIKRIIINNADEIFIGREGNNFIKYYFKFYKTTEGIEISYVKENYNLNRYNYDCGIILEDDVNNIREKMIRIK